MPQWHQTYPTAEITISDILNMSNEEKKRNTSSLPVQEDDAQISKKAKTAEEPWEHSLNTKISVLSSLEWPPNRCIRELLLNCMDEDANTEVKKVDERTWKITNKVRSGRESLRSENFCYAANSEKVADRLRNGKYGYGLKDAVVLLTAHGIHYVARSCNGSFKGCVDAKGNVSILINPHDCISDGVEQYLSISDGSQLDLEREIKRAEAQCIGFRIRDVYTSFIPVEVCDSDSASTPLGTVYIPPLNSQDEAECDGTTELFVHGCAYVFSGDETNKRKSLALIYNLHVDKATIEGRDRAGLPKNWESALTRLIKEAPDSVFNRLLQLRKLNGYRFYEFGNQHIANYINAHVAVQSEAARRICAESTRAREDAERAVADQTAARRQVQHSELKCRETETEDVPTTDVRRRERELVEYKENLHAATLRAEQLQAIAAAKANEAEKVVRAADPTVLVFPDEYNVGDMKVQLVRIPSVKHAQWLKGEVPWIEEFTLMESAHIDRKFTPIFRQLRRLLYVLGLKDRVTIHPQTDSSVPAAILVVLRDCKLYVRFDAAEMHVLRDAILQLSTAGLHAELSGRTLVDSVAQVAALMLQFIVEEPTAIAKRSATECPTYLGQLLSSAAVMPFCPLLVATEWDTKFGGISSFNIQLAKGLAAELRRVGGTRAHSQPVVFIMVLGTDDINKATHKQWREAAVLGIKIVDGALYRGVYTPCLTCGEFARITHIVGHAHITGEEAVGMRRLQQLRHAKLWQINHVLPLEVDTLKADGTAQSRQESARKKEAGLKKLNKEADHVFSVGEMMYDHFEYTLHRGGRIPNTGHTQLVLPLNPDFYDCPTDKEDFSVSTIQVLYFGRTDSAIYVKGVDIAVRALEQVRKDNAFVHSRRKIRLTVRGTTLGTEAATVQKLIADQQARYRDIAPGVECFASPAEVREDLRRTDIVIMPSRNEPFGLVAMEAIACRVPVLVSSNSGIARLLTEHDMEKLCVQTSAHHPDSTSDASRQADVDAWSSAILGLIAQGPQAFTRAKDLAEKFMRKITDPYSEMITLGSAAPVTNTASG